jgi:hypothetical protein
MDFFPVTTFQGLTESAASDFHLVQTAQMPEPGTLALIGGTLVFLSRLRRHS